MLAVLKGLYNAVQGFYTSFVSFFGDRFRASEHVEEFPAALFESCLLLLYSSSLVVLSFCC